jgi:hypothetical protein
MSFQTECNRLRLLDWSKVGTACTELHRDQAVDFLRRSATVLNTFAMTSRSPIFGPSLLFGGRYDLPHDVVREFESIPSLIEHPVVLQVVEIHLQFWMAAEVESSFNYGILTALCLPLIDIFASGGEVSSHHGDFVVDGEWTIPMRNWQERFASQ